jgi:CRISPR system Cascade subunit CasC
MFIEIHALQNFAPSNLNRDDTGSPKDCDFGGHRRARVSSQCWKRAIREYFTQEELVPETQRSTRTKKLVGKLAERLIALNSERKPEDAMAVGAAAVEALGIGFDAKSKDEKKTSVLLFLGNDQIEMLVSVCHEHWEQLISDPARKKQTILPKEISSRLRASLQGSRAVDLALFGRMIAEDPAQNVDAACQVAHAISTHRVAPEFDYYTAVDDLGRDDETGAGMLGTQEFNSACFYRYANVNLAQLEGNLQADRELALSGTRAFLESFIMAIPKAKQNGSAAQSLPSFVMIVVREKGLSSLANAFARPVDGRDKGLTVNSVEALAQYWGKLSAMYGGNGIRVSACATIEGDGLNALTSNRVQKVGSVSDLLDLTMAALGGGQ